VGRRQHVGLELLTLRRVRRAVPFERHLIASLAFIIFLDKNIRVVEYSTGMLESFRALAEPSRLQIIDLLLREPLPVGAVADRLGIRQPQASKHLRILSEAGLVEVRPDAQRRIYALRAQPFQEIDGWLERYRSLFAEQFERLDQVLVELQSIKKPVKEKRKAARRRR